MSRQTTALGAFAVANAMALSACSGSGPSPNVGGGVQNNSQLGNTGHARDATAKGPVTISGAESGGTVTVLTRGGLATTIDPSEAYYTTPRRS